MTFCVLLKTFFLVGNIFEKVSSKGQTCGKAIVWELWMHIQIIILVIFHTNFKVKSVKNCLKCKEKPKKARQIIVKIAKKYVGIVIVLLNTIK